MKSRFLYSLSFYLRRPVSESSADYEEVCACLTVHRICTVYVSEHSIFCCWCVLYLSLVTNYQSMLFFSQFLKNKSEPPRNWQQASSFRQFLAIHELLLLWVRLSPSVRSATFSRSSSEAPELLGNVQGALFFTQSIFSGLMQMPDKVFYRSRDSGPRPDLSTPLWDHICWNTFWP